MCAQKPPEFNDDKSDDEVRRGWWWGKDCVGNGLVRIYLRLFAIRSHRRTRVRFALGKSCGHAFVGALIARRLHACVFASVCRRGIRIVRRIN